VPRSSAAGHRAALAGWARPVGTAGRALRWQPPDPGSAEQADMALAKGMRR